MDLIEAASFIFSGISAALKHKKGFLVGRNGTIEMEILLQKHFQNTFFQQQLLILERNAGVFPATANSAHQWIRATEEAIRNTDLLVAGWYAPIANEERQYIKTLGKNGPYLPLRALEPYYVPYEHQWSRFFLYRKVAIVSSFANFAVDQSKHANLLWPDRHDSLLPEADYIAIETGYAPSLAQGRAAWPSSIDSWQEAVDSVVKQVVDSGAEIVLIGCGGLGMIIGHRLKELGKVCIVMGGAIQVLFGIKGKRWETHSVISRFWNPTWKYPPLERVPLGADKIEGGCYWGPKAETPS